MRGPVHGHRDVAAVTSRPDERAEPRGAATSRMRFGSFVALEGAQLDVAAGTVPRAARRERRRQEHLRQVRDRLPAGRPPARSSTTGARSRSRARARRTRSASAWSTSSSRWSPNMTVAENLVLVRDRRAGDHRLEEGARRARRLHGRASRSRCRCTAPVRSLSAGPEAEARDPEAALPEPEAARSSTSRPRC